MVNCLDLRNEPFKLASAGLTGAETAADIGRQLNLFPLPRPEKRYSLIECARIMGLPTEGEGAHPRRRGRGRGRAHVLGTPS